MASSHSTQSNTTANIPDTKQKLIFDVISLLFPFLHDPNDVLSLLLANRSLYSPGIRALWSRPRVLRSHSDIYSFVTFIFADLEKRAGWLRDVTILPPHPLTQSGALLTPASFPPPPTPPSNGTSVPTSTLDPGLPLGSLLVTVLQHASHLRSLNISELEDWLRSSARHHHPCLALGPVLSSLPALETLCFTVKDYNQQPFILDEFFSPTILYDQHFPPTIRHLKLAFATAVDDLSVLSQIPASIHTLTLINAKFSFPFPTPTCPGVKVMSLKDWREPCNLDLLMRVFPNLEELSCEKESSEFGKWGRRHFGNSSRTSLVTPTTEQDPQNTGAPTGAEISAWREHGIKLKGTSQSLYGLGLNAMMFSEPIPITRLEVDALKDSTLNRLMQVLEDTGPRCLRLAITTLALMKSRASSRASSRRGSWSGSDGEGARFVMEEGAEAFKDIKELHLSVKAYRHSHRSGRVPSTEEDTEAVLSFISTFPSLTRLSLSLGFDTPSPSVSPSDSDSESEEDDAYEDEDDAYQIAKHIISDAAPQTLRHLAFQSPSSPLTFWEISRNYEGEDEGQSVPEVFDVPRGDAMRNWEMPVKEDARKGGDERVGVAYM